MSDRGAVKKDQYDGEPEADAEAANPSSVSRGASDANPSSRSLGAKSSPTRKRLIIMIVPSNSIPNVVGLSIIPSTIPWTICAKYFKRSKTDEE